jgi:DNA modification methylase
MKPPTPYFDDGDTTLYHGDCLDVLRGISDASVDAVVCDPPYGLEFMGREWDGADGFRRSLNANDVGRDSVFGRQSARAPEYRTAVTKSGETLQLFQRWCEQWAAECLRVLKPGGHLLAFGAARTYHRLASGIEDAGFEIRDSIHWLYGSGMPKGVDIAKAIDKRRDDRADVLRVTVWLAAARDAAGWSNQQIDDLWGFNGMGGHWTTQGIAACVPTPEQWARLRDELGFDDAAILPLVESLNGRRGETGEAWAQREVIGEAYRVRRESAVQIAGLSDGAYDVTAPATDDAQRWQGWNTQLKPAHEPIIVARKTTGFNTTVANVLEHGTGALNIDACRTEAHDTAYARNAAGDRGHAENRDRQMDFRQTAGHANDLGRWPANVVFSHGEECAGACAPGCPITELDAQSGVLTSGANPARRNAPKFGTAYGEFEGDRDCIPARGADSGGASRFFPAFRYEAKAPASERPKLADGTQHVSVKPLDLMRWLVRLVTPPGGTVLDPFAGSGTTLEAAVLENFHAIGIEREQQYADLCVARLSKPLQPSLFGTDA